MLAARPLLKRTASRLYRSPGRLASGAQSLGRRPLGGRHIWQESHKIAATESFEGLGAVASFRGRWWLGPFDHPRPDPTKPPPRRGLRWSGANCEPAKTFLISEGGHGRRSLNEAILKGCTSGISARDSLLAQAIGFGPVAVSQIACGLLSTQPKCMVEVLTIADDGAQRAAQCGGALSRSCPRPLSALCGTVRLPGTGATWLRSTTDDTMDSPRLNRRKSSDHRRLFVPCAGGLPACHVAVGRSAVSAEAGRRPWAFCEQQRPPPTKRSRP